jgi:ubiquinone/menaquinone biosynthesis C-methylase UbiE
MAQTKTKTMHLSTSLKVVGVAIVLMLLIVYIVRTTTTMTDLQVQRDVEQFVNPAQPPIKDYTKKELEFFQYQSHTTSESIYDTYYAGMYSKLFDQHKLKLVEFECYDMQYRTKLEEYGRRAVILDLGCGTGEHLRWLAQDNPKAELHGLDISKAMLDRAQKKLSKYNDRVRFVQGDFNNPNAVYDKMFTHITCFYFSFYYSESPKLFFDNCYKWLKTRGHLCVHIVHPMKFNPLPHVANPIKGISLQNYLDKRKTDCKVYFQNTLYKSDFQYNEKENRAKLQEQFIHPKKQTVREHTHHLHMYHHETIIRIARKCGFRLRHITKLFEIGQDNEYLCYLQKQ